MIRRAAILAASTIATVLAAGAVTVPAADARKATPASSASIDWKLCTTVDSAWNRNDPATLCGTVWVPLDYGKPDGRQIGIRVSKIPAKQTARRRGALLVNPGGPGVGGSSFVAGLLGEPFGSMNERFDLIGFDPRGARANLRPAAHTRAPPRALSIRPMPG